MKINSTIFGLVTSVLVAVSGSAFAADWKPDGTLKMQIGFGAGGSTDTMGRVLAKVMEEQTG